MMPVYHRILLHHEDAGAVQHQYALLVDSSAIHHQINGDSHSEAAMHVAKGQRSGMEFVHVALRQYVLLTVAQDQLPRSDRS
jgi:hypothetical protein